MSKEGIDTKKDLVEKDIGERLAGHNDSTTGAMVSRELLTKLSTEERIALAGEVARARYKEKNSITEVYRNAAYLANPLIMQIVRDNGYPASEEDLEAFFKLGEQANAGNEGAKKSLIEYLDKVPLQMVQALMPMYHEYLSDANKETKEQAIKKISGLSAERRTKILSELGVKGIPEDKLAEKVTEELNKLSDEQVQNIRTNEAKVAFMGSIAFAFVEQRAFEMGVSDPKMLQGKFRELRDKEPELMNGLILALDNANVNYEPPRKIDDKVKNVVTKVYDSALEKVKEIKEANKQVETSLKNTEVALDKLCKELKKNANEDDAKLIEDMRSLCGNIFNRLNVSIGLKGEKISKQDVDNEINATVNKTVNGKNLITFAVNQGNKEAVETLVTSGADISVKTADYKRSPLQALKDGFKDFPKNLGQLFKKPERTLIDIVKISGNKEIESVLEKAGETQLKKETAIDPTLVGELEKTLHTRLVGELEKTLHSRRVISDTPPNKPVPSLPESTIPTEVTKLSESTPIHTIPESHQSKPLPVFPSNPQGIVKLRTQTPETEPEPHIHPVAKGFINQIDSLLKTLASEHEKSVSNKEDPLNIKLLEVEQKVVTSLKDYLKTADLDTSEGKIALQEKIDEIRKSAQEQRKEANQGFVYEHPIMTEEVRGLLNSIYEKVSQPEKTSKFGKNH